MSTQAAELEQLAEIRNNHPRGTIPRAAYEAALQRLRRDPTDGAISHLRKTLADTHPAPRPPGPALTFDDTVIEEMGRHSSLRAYYDATWGHTTDTMAFPAWYRAYRRNVEPERRYQIAEAMAAHRPNRRGLPLPPL